MFAVLPSALVVIWQLTFCVDMNFMSSFVNYTLFRHHLIRKLGERDVMRYATLLIVLITAVATVDAQDISNTPRKTLKWQYYRLSLEQSKKLYQSHTRADIEAFMTDLYMEVPIDSVNLKLPTDPGHYLRVYGEGNNLVYASHSIPFLRIEAQGVIGEGQLRLYDFDGNLVKDARVKLLEKEDKWQELPFDAGCACYAVKTKTHQRLLTIEHKGRYDVFKATNSGLNKPSIDRSNPYGGNRHVYPGYMVFNKPKFRHFDTLKMKAFLVTNDGHPLRRKLDLWLHADGKKALLATLKPVSSGAYTYNLYLSDSLPLNRAIRLSLNHRGRQIKSNSAIVEDYELKKARYESRMLKSYFKAGDRVEIIADALDANSMPMLDTRIKVNVELLNSHSLYPLTHSATDLALSHLFRYDELIDESGTSIVQIPNDRFLPISGTYQATVNYLNTAGEFKTQKHVFNYDAKVSYYRDVQFDNQLLIEHYLDGKLNKGVQAILKVFQGENLLKSTVDALPFQKEIHPATDRYELWVDDSMVLANTIADRSMVSIKVEGKRTHDSIYVSLTNSWKVPVYYRIYRNNKIVHKGFGTELDFKDRDRSMYPYYVIYGYQWAGREHSYEVQLNVKEKELQVTLDLPEAIYPGERVNGSISVTDYLGRPVKRANLTAWAVNMEFPDIPLPDMPYFGRRFPKMSSRTRFTVDRCAFSGRRKLNYTTVEGLNISDTNYYYTLRYPGKKKQVFYQKNAYERPEFVILVMDGGEEISVQSVWIDDRLWYNAANGPRQHMVFRYDPGPHQLTIHTPDTVITTKVELKEFHRLFLSLDPKRITGDGTSTTARTTPYFWEKDEVGQMERQTLYLDNSVIYTDTVWVENDGLKWLLSIPGKSNNKTYFYPQLQKTLMSFHGLKEGPTVLRINRDTFYFSFKPGQYYVPERGVLTHHLLPSLPINRELMNRSTTNYFEYSLSASPFYFKNEVKKLEKQRVLDEKEQRLKAPWYESMQVYQYHRNVTSERSRIKFFNPQYKSIKHFWLINENLKHFSHASYGTTGNSELTMKPGTYTLVAIDAKGRTLLQKGITLKKDALFMQNIWPSQFSDTSEATITPYREVLHQLSRPKIQKASLYPHTLEGRWEFKKDTGDYGSILGVLKSQSTGKVVGNAVVILEQQGVVKDAVITNSWGEYVFRNLVEGVYSLKINERDFRYTTLKQINVKNGFTSFIQTDLELKDDYWKLAQSQGLWAQPFVDVVLKVQGRPKVHLVVHDISSGQALVGSEVSLYRKNKLIMTALTDINGAARFDGLDAGPYNLEVSFIGYGRKRFSLRLSERHGYEVKVPMSPLITDVFEIELDESVEDVEMLTEVRRESLIKESYGGLDSRTTEEIRKLPVRGATGIIATTGGVQSIDGGDPIIRGGRSDQVITYIDGMPVRGSGVPAEFGDAAMTDSLSSDPAGSIPLVDRLAKGLGLLGNRTPPNRLRTAFRDYAYWVPNMVTDRDGEAHFSVKFPDNITQWQHIVPAMDHHRNTALLTQMTKAFLPYSAQLALPRFLVKGDSVALTGKVFNYTDSAIEAQVLLQVDEVDLLVRQDSIKRRTSYSTSYEAKVADSVKVSFTIRSKEKAFKEGEERHLKIFEDFIELAETKAYTVTRDTTIAMSAAVGEKIGVVVFNDRRQFLQDQIDRLKRYDYGCTEQTASKLQALLAEKALCNQLGKPFTQDKMVKKMIARLARFQKVSGAWGWYPKDDMDSWITIYVIEALANAQKHGYNSFAYTRGMNYLKRRHEGFADTDYLNALGRLLQLGFKADTSRFNRLKYRGLTDHDKLQYLAIAQHFETDMNVSNEVLKLVKKDACGVAYWGNRHRLFYHDQSTTTLLALKLLAKEGGHPQMVKAIEKTYFSEACKRGAMNTLQRALLIGFVLENLETDIKKELEQGFMVNGEKVQKFPYRHEQKGGGLSVDYTGNIEAMVLTYRIREVREASPDSAYFKVKTQILQNGKKTDAVQQGSSFEVQVSTYNRLSANHVVIEIPIPAGCSYATQQDAPIQGEIHREYRRNKVVIYCTEFLAAQRNFTIRLEPRFQGRFTLLPAKVEQMYFPSQSGNNSSKTLLIGEDEK